MRLKSFTSLFNVVLLIFFLSGFSGLIYQVVWVKLLGRVFGITTFAISAVLGAFFAGLALGGWLGGRLAERKIDGVKVFGILQISIALYAVALFPIFDSLVNIYRAIYPTLESSPALLTFVRFILSFILLIIPTTMMGAGLPLLIKALVSQRDEFGNKLSQLYSLQTFGSVLGSLLTGFIFIGVFGLRTSVMIAVLCDLITGTIALMIATRNPVAERRTVLRSTAPDQPSASNFQFLIPAVMFLSGFASLGYEVVWTRVLSAMSYHSVYIFSGIVAAVLIGITVGSYAVSGFRKQIHDPAPYLIGSQIVLGISALLWMPAMILVGNIFGAGAANSTPGNVPTSIIVGALLVTLIPSFCMGLNFPLGAQLYAREMEKLGRQVGELFSVNVLGATLGSIIAGFFFIPLLGTQRSLLVLGLINLFAALWLAQQEKWRKTFIAIGMMIVGFVGMMTLAPNTYYAAIFRAVHASAPIVANFEGVDGTVTVAESGEVKTIYLNGAHQANSSPNMLGVHRFIGYLPITVHANPQRALIIGLGGGATSGAVASRTTSVKVIELSDGMVAAARLFGEANQFVVENPKVQISVADGRNFVALTEERYDIITADIIPPLHAYSSNLYSVEYFRSLATRLNKNGLVSQWIDSSLLPHERQILTRTFVQAFPYTVIWQAGGLTIALGSNDPIELNPEIIRQNFTPEVAAAAKVLKVETPEQLHAAFRLVDENYKSEIGAGLIISDDHPYNEHFRLLRVGDIWRLLE